MIIFLKNNERNSIDDSMKFNLQEQKEYWKRYPLNQDYRDQLFEHLRNMFVLIVILIRKKIDRLFEEEDVGINLPAPVS